MTTIVGLAVVVMAVTLLVLAAFMIPAFIEVRKTAAAMREFITCTENELKPVLKDLNETLARMKVLTDEATDRVEGLRSFVDALRDTGRNIRTVNEYIGTASHLMARSTVWVSGAKVAGRFLIDKFTKKRG